MFVKFIYILLSLLVVQQASAAENDNNSRWKSSAELGYVNVSGNTNTETLKFVFDVSYEVEKWLHKVHAEALSSKSETTDETVTPVVTREERSAAKWFLSGQSDYKFNDSDYFYGLISYEDDRFSGFYYQAKLGFGYGRRVIHTENHELKLEIGPGYRAFKLEPTLPPAAAVDTERQDEGLLRLGAGYTWRLSETSKLTEDISAEFGEDQDEWKSVTTLLATINSVLAMKLSYTVKHLDKVPAGSMNTDRETAVTLVFTF